MTLRPGDVLLDDAKIWPGSAMLFTRPRARIVCDDPARVAAALARIDRAVADGFFVAGAFSYELGHLLEHRLAPLLPDRRPEPLIDVGIYDAPQNLDGSAVLALFPASDRSISLTDLVPRIDRAAYDDAFARVKNYIAAGDVYQINLTFPIDARISGDPLSLYPALRFRARAGHGVVMVGDEHTILSLSPELFLAGQGGVITARPMKGTCARNPDPANDQSEATALGRDEKQRAENLMIVDLIRNDLSRVAESGTVRASALFTVETYPTLHTMTSCVSAVTKAGTTPSVLLRALFPCGSVTGAPKIRAMEIIRELEPHPRGIYCGALGAFGPAGFVHLNVAIRTLVCARDGSVRLNVGSGVVADSGKTSEYDECLLKARFATDQRPLFTLIETMRHAHGRGIVLLARHLERLERSAKWFGFACDTGAVARAVHAQGAQTQGAQIQGAQAKAHDLRIRVALAADGSFTLASESLPDADWVEGLPRDPGTLTVCIADETLAADDPFVRFKTSARAHYELPLARARAQGADEVVFLNQRGEICEAARMTVFVPRDGVLLTPPLDAPCLDGVLRAELIARGAARASVLRVDDLAQGFYLGNAVRGLKPARLT